MAKLGGRGYLGLNVLKANREKKKIAVKVVQLRREPCDYTTGLSIGKLGGFPKVLRPRNERENRTSKKSGF